MEDYYKEKIKQRLEEEKKKQEKIKERASAQMKRGVRFYERGMYEVGLTCSESPFERPICLAEENARIAKRRGKNWLK